MASKSTEGINFYLRSGPGYANHILYMQFWFQNQRLRYNLRQPVDPKMWNPNKQKVKDANALTVDGRHSINDLIDKIGQTCLEAYRAELANGQPTPAIIKKHLDKFMNYNKVIEKAASVRPTLFDFFERVISGEVTITKGKQKGKQRSTGTLKAMNTTFMHLKVFEKTTGFKVDFDTITQDFFDKFTSYLKNKKISLNTRGRHIKDVKTVMGDAIKRKYEVDGIRYPYTTNIDFMDFAVTSEDVENVYLSWDEIAMLYRFDLGGHPSLERVRDLFVFGCMVGLRYSDYSKVKPQNIIEVAGEKFLYVRTKKTSDYIYIPCNPIVLDIFDKYADSPNKLPTAISEAKFNLYIKKAASMAGFTETGRLLSDPEKQLCDCISSHTARRSMATNYYLDGFPPIDLMKITGHKTEKSFLTYIKVSKLKAAQRLAEHNRRKNWAVLVGGIAEKQLRAV